MKTANDNEIIVEQMDKQKKYCDMAKKILAERLNSKLNIVLDLSRNCLKAGIPIPAYYSSRIDLIRELDKELDLGIDVDKKILDMKKEITKKDFRWNSKKDFRYFDKKDFHRIFFDGEKFSMKKNFQKKIFYEKKFQKRNFYEILYI